MQTYLNAAYILSAIVLALGLLPAIPETPLLLAAALTVIVGMAHSILGERRLIRPLLQLPNLPHLPGQIDFTRATIRFAWHITTIAWWGFAGVMAAMYFSPESVNPPFLWVSCAVFACSGLIALAATRAAHKAWQFFFAIAACCGYVALSA